MAIKKDVTPKDPDAFISGAPDSGASKEVEAPTKGKKRERQEIVAVGFPPAMIEQLAEASESMGLSRSAWIVMVCAKALKEAV